jgi:hypothetical protein
MTFSNLFLKEILLKDLNLKIDLIFNNNKNPLNEYLIDW